MFELAELAQVNPDADEAQLHRRMEELELAKSAAAAGQARCAVLMDEKRRAREAAAGVPRAKQGRGVASEIALARHDSPTCGSRHLGFAKALVHEMPHTLRALESGVLSEWRATLIVRESACLTVEDRRALDAEMCADIAKLVGKGNNAIEAEAKKIAYRLDAQAIVDRAAKAAEDRTVTIRPAPDCMARVTVLLPVQQGVGMYAALKRKADTTFDGRTRGQVMADTAVERVTGRPADAPEPIAVNMTISDQTLFGDDDSPAVVEGYGPVPASVARKLVGDAVVDKRSRATLRRLYLHPGSGALVAMESRSRLFPKGLAQFIRLRDQVCRTPYCGAPIRHLDHARPRAGGGPTSALNGLGECEHCNYVKESPGWSVTTSDENGLHTAEFVTPTGACYRSTAPPPPGRVEVYESATELRIAIEVVRCANAA
ncbi:MULTISPECIES: HNH endonuclease [Mycolicibacterium]|uniref:HNH endonuclease n=1 Tax=Mycolicibacterium TaxID=1866885 RepID=UPI001E305CE8|nr:DUF222 domain-containing protein [Mycolicibacterium mageritense]MBN3456864.1 DUF222 domain-containing protein [Mycobacterium sp. DSM 3803]GJJ16481.1 HNH endonuclease [Mycolicibacterium mageritense]